MSLLKPLVSCVYSYIYKTKTNRKHQGLLFWFVKAALVDQTQWVTLPILRHRE